MTRGDDDKDWALPAEEELKMRDLVPEKRGEARRDYYRLGFNASRIWCAKQVIELAKGLGITKEQANPIMKKILAEKWNKKVETNENTNNIV